MSREFLDPKEWLHHATALPVGGRKRVPHDCGDGDSLLITREHDKSTAYCFRCGGTGFYREHESLEAKLERTTRQLAADSAARASLALPEPVVLDTRLWPQADKVWFFKMGLSPRMIGELGLYWCPDLGRVVLPIMEGGRTVYWTARSQSRTPKWLTPTVPKQGLVARYGVGKGSMIVLCEDPLSAYKIGQVTEAWSLLGTKLHDKVLLELAQQQKTVATWLDDDVGRANGRNPGQEAATEIGARLRSFGIHHKNITSKRDPKYYDSEEIGRKVCTTTTTLGGK